MAFFPAFCGVHARTGVQALKSNSFFAAIVLFAALRSACAAEALAPPAIDFLGHPASADARYAADWIAGNADNQNMPFVIVDKKHARMFVFEADGQLRGTTAVLLGAGPGDASIPGIAGRAPASLQLHERTTPAGRFVSEPGRNLTGEDIIWVDYAAKIAIHRLRPDAARQQRADRLASSLADVKRVTLGCIVVPVGFYENVVRPALGKRYGVVYVLPEDGAAHRMFDDFS
ncbi:MAG: hypothetical protein JWR68_1505 [Polaromonas sp.]|nr:hypothetical protein [Polaromonas sp.]